MAVERNRHCTIEEHSACVVNLNKLLVWERIWSHVQVVLKFMNVFCQYTLVFALHKKRVLPVFMHPTCSNWSMLKFCDAKNSTPAIVKVMVRERCFHIKEDL